jgi:hypothetical protein
MRVAWVHPTWRDLVIERLTGDAALRHRFLGRCGPHGIVLALSTAGGTGGERRLPLICDDEDWDAIGDRIYALAPDLEHAELVAVFAAVGLAVTELTREEPARSGEARVLARMALERTDSVWTAANAPVPLDCIDAWLRLSQHFDPVVWPGFLAPTWAELLPTELPDPGDLPEVERFTDWMTLSELIGNFSLELLGELGYGSVQGKLRRDFRDRELRKLGVVQRIGASPVQDALIEESRARRISDGVVRRVLADL